MMNTELLCRICLAEGATIPIFEDYRNEARLNSSVQSKLTLCLNEELEDVAGYPRYICDNCQGTLNTVVDFINKYKESCIILEKRLQVIVKQEYIENDHNNDFVYFEDCTFETSECRPIKKEIKIEIDDRESKAKIKPLRKSKINSKKKSKIQTKKKTSPIKKKTATRPQKYINSNAKTNSIRSSILEGEFVWNGEKWCHTKPSNTKKNNRIDKNKHQVDNENDVTQHCPKPEKKPAEPILCEACGETFENSTKLKLHEVRKHKNLSTCPTCNMTLASPYYLQNHIKRIHSDTKDFICSKCGKGFAFQKDLNSHIKVVHKRLRIRVLPRVPCKLCDRDFANKNALLVHERAVHTGERPAICTVCDASFYSIEYLKQHMRIHTGECPYKCPVCGRGYSQACNMKSHMRNHRISELDQETLSKIKPSWHKFMKP